MKVRRERPSQRLNHRINAPVKIETPQGIFKAVDWSLGGFRIEGYSGSAAQGDDIAVTVHIPFQGFDISFPVEAKVVRIFENGEMAAEFAEVGDREREIMSHFIDDLVRGSMTVTDDVIMRLDSPVTMVSTKPDPNPDEQVPLRRRSLKSLAMTAFYLTVGLGVVAYAALFIFTNFFRLEIDTAVVSAPVEPLIAPTDGRIGRITVGPNNAVAGSTPLIVIEDARIQQAIDLAGIEVDRATMELLAKQRELKAEEERVRGYQAIGLARIERASAKIKSLKEQVELAMARKQRFDILFKEGWTTKSKLDEIQSNYADLTGKLEEARSLMHERRMLLDGIEEGRFFNGGNFEGSLKELQAAVDLGADQVMLAKDELSALKRHRRSLVLTAPGDGRILKLLKNVGSFIKRGEEIALFERDEARTIEAFLTQEEVLEIGLGDQATVYFPSLDRRVNALVTSIDRTTGHLDEIESRYIWRGPKDRSAKVTLHFADIKVNDIRRFYTPGLPAIVIFERRGTDELKGRIMNGLIRTVSTLGRET